MWGNFQQTKHKLAPLCWYYRFTSRLITVALSKLIVLITVALSHSGSISRTFRSRSRTTCKGLKGPSRSCSRAGVGLLLRASFKGTPVSYATSRWPCLSFRRPARVLRCGLICQEVINFTTTHRIPLSPQRPSRYEGDQRPLQLSRIFLNVLGSNQNQPPQWV